MADYIVPHNPESNENTGKEGLEDGLLPSSFESGPSRPPTPHGEGYPTNFAEVVQGIYRSSFPLPVHLSSVAKLNLKTIVTLVDEEWSPEYRQFVKDNDITSYVIPILANKSPQISTPQSTVDRVLKILLNPSNHPLVVHCNKGRHRTGCIMACFRRIQGWSLPAAIAEYVKHATPKTRVLDRNFIENYDPTVLADVADKVGASKWLPTIVPVDYHAMSRAKVYGDVASADDDHLKHHPKAKSAPPEAFIGNLEGMHRVNTV
ncbi:hypothetical protein AJ80_03005 [Polytolypa hystricis UAMH7299]|uniref:diphosphoinositol-polyphosphate diphosphatase n=1 Tax=Polytolypa hystricis (strain UAMH7299) TaxID=1447883 RepID=A0A2B7YMY0_POLH7|nr:hypothetical protein AJ80_03005 [Polytolypa hystricis UAMH7299]